MSEEKTNSDELYRAIMAQKPTEVKLALSKIDEILKKDLANEAFEDCAILRDAKVPLQEYLDGKVPYDKIKDLHYFVNHKISGLISDATKK